jgi:myo-inositol-1(or 4)-monophosphatase
MLTSADTAHRLAVASEAIREAGQLVLSFYRRPQELDIRFKGPQDLVTAADHAADALLQRRIGAAFPGDTFLTEESGGENGRRLWVIDPIDGTANFARGLPHFCISVAFCVDGQARLGVIYNPIQDELFVAETGGGATCNGRVLSVSGVREPGQALVDAGYSHRHPKSDYLGLIGRILDGGFAFSQAGSAALGLAYVADGRIDGYCEQDLYAWDVLAGLLLVREAGGWASDFPLEDGPARGKPVLACTPALASDLRRLIGI